LVIVVGAVVGHGLCELIAVEGGRLFASAAKLLR
jgi:putative Ca2+/H+ antiporter (TMEM165/GDT1 family)